MNNQMEPLNPVTAAYLERTAKVLINGLQPIRDQPIIQICDFEITAVMIEAVLRVVYQHGYQDGQAAATPRPILCSCSCGDTCPLGHTGMVVRCSVEKLKAAGYCLDSEGLPELAVQ